MGSRFEPEIDLKATASLLEKNGTEVGTLNPHLTLVIPQVQRSLLERKKQLIR